jgi:hypothetical protein
MDVKFEALAGLDLMQCASRDRRELMLCIQNPQEYRLNFNRYTKNEQNISKKTASSTSKYRPTS